MPVRVWLDVAFSEKDQAKAAGARWDREQRRWYAGPSADMSVLERWAPRPELPTTLPGEDRTFGSGLFVDLIPSSCWFTNVRSCISSGDWERLRRVVVERASNRCEACSSPPDQSRQLYMDCHERWFFQESNHTQYLRRLVCLCSLCHEATHMGLAQVRGREAQALAQLMRVTDMSRAEAVRHRDEAFELWAERNRYEWSLDLRILTDAGIEVTPPARNRRAAAVAELRRHAREPGEGADP